MIGATTIKAQSFTYHSMKEFKGDTIAFLKQNFHQQRSYFVGKKFGELLELYMREMPLKGCYVHNTSPSVDPNNESYICGAWLRPMENSFLPRDTMKAVYAVTFDVDFMPPYVDSFYDFGKSLPDNISPYGIAYKLKDYIIKDIRIEAYDRRRKY